MERGVDTPVSVSSLPSLPVYLEQDVQETWYLLLVRDYLLLDIPKVRPWRNTESRGVPTGGFLDVVWVRGLNPKLGLSLSGGEFLSPPCVVYGVYRMVLGFVSKTDVPLETVRRPGSRY